MSLILRHLPWLLRRTLLASIDDGLFAVAKGAAYSALLAFFPLLTSLAAVVVETRTEVVQNYLARFLALDVSPRVLLGTGVKVVKIVLQETENCFAQCVVG